MDELNDIRFVLNEFLAEERVAKKHQKSLQTKLTAHKNAAIEIGEVQNLFQTAVKLMYDNLSAKLGAIITEGLNTVFPDSKYKFCIDFVEKRNGVEAIIYLEDSDGYRYHPTDDVGGGIADFVSFFLRIAYVMLSKYENIIIADEPLKFVSVDRIDELAEFISKVAKELKLQLLIITHIEALTQNSDRIYKVRKRKGISVVKEIKNS